MINFLIVAIKFIFLLGFLVLIHEGGHFIVAKLCKVRVHDFAIGFGPAIIKKRIGETLYTLRLIPLGGFVRMEGEEEASDDEASFSQKSIPQRIAIVMAGGAVNIIFGLVVYFILVSNAGNYISMNVATVESGYGAQVAGIMPGDEIVKINGKSVHLKSDLEEAIAKSGGNTVTVEVKRNNELINIEVVPKEKVSKNTGVYFGASGSKLSSKIKSIYPDSPAEKAGLKKNDVIIAVNGQEVNNDPYKAIELTQNADADNIKYTIERNGEQIDFEVTPKKVSTYYLGVELAKTNGNFFENMSYGFWDTVDFSASILDNLKMLFTGKVSADQLMGPIGISGMVADTNGWFEFVYLLALISLSLGVTNLLPIPPLDGWKIVVYLIEAIRRKPLDEKTQMNIDALGFVFMIALSLYVAYNDILRL